MKSRKTVVFAPLALALGLSAILPACSSDNKGSSASPAATAASTSASTAAVASPQALAPYEVSIVYHGKPQKDDALVQEKLNEYLKAKMNTTVLLQPIAPSDYKKKTELMMNTGEKMDLVFTASWLDFSANVTKGAFIELDALLDKFAPDTKKALHPLYLEAPRYKGKLYAIPTNKEITQGKAFTFRKDIVDKYNIPTDKINKMEDLEPYFEIIKQKEPEMINNYVAGGPASFMMYESKSNYRPIGPVPAKLPMFFLDYKSQEMKVKTVLDQDIIDLNKADAEMFRRYYEKGYTNADAATVTTNIADIRKQGKIWQQTTVWKPGSDIELKLSDNFDWVSHVIEEPIVTTDLATGSMLSISRTSKNPERAMMVLNYLHTDPYVINLVVNGIEGKHYKKISANRIEPIKDSGYDGGLFWVLGNQFLNYLKPGQPDDLYESWKKFNNDAKRFPLLGFVFDDTNVKNEIAQLTTIVNEYKVISTGAVPNPVKLLDERNAKLKAAGLEKVKTELQTQIDAWWKENKK
ncbi:ABC transporter substrate-binding protein [Paenibacillus sp. HWE-109]|uniref:ABC transporter substrate-binding protein n=1 Tax=Paenibacillus sp. HWE-109 TaxID=1306526 RepID=UPI001EDEAC81|nr:ABC transporter substrate-binding protein [Paenibacillus sp. HWE-109]UKS29306.1 ABC transporter substrate-binding protein [Paenibacillus sp. HWE-109]